jgi:hypothetical protein
VRLPDNTTISGFLGLYDDNIAIVTAFCTAHVYPVDTSEIVDLHQQTDRPNLFVLGRTYGGPLMGAECSPLDFTEAAVSCDCAITQSGLGGSVILLDRDGNGHFVGVMVQVPTVQAPGACLALVRGQRRAPATGLWVSTPLLVAALPSGVGAPCSSTTPLLRWPVSILRRGSCWAGELSLS